MNGTQHMAIGAATGFITANSLDSTPTTTLLLVGLGAVAGLIPDIDVDGKLSNRITFSHKMIRTVAQSIGALMMIYSFLEGGNIERWTGIGVGLAIMVIASFLTQRRMLSVTAIGVIVGGISLDESWLLLLGIYILIASFIPHRSYTHSILGIIFFGIIAKQFEDSINVDGVYTTLLLAYISHLVADMKILPFNKKGVKWFLPFWSKEF